MKLRRIDFYPDDFIVGVAGMSAENIGIYWLVNSLIYSSGGSIPVNDERIFRVCGSRPVKVKRAIYDLVASGKLVVDGSQMYCRRAIDEIQAAHRRITGARENGAKGGRPNMLEKPPGFLSDNPPAPSPSPPPPKKEEVEDLGLALANQLTGRKKRLPPEQRKAIWESNICRELERRLPASEYQAWMVAYAGGDSRAKQLAEDTDRLIKAEKARRQNGRHP